MIFKTVASRIAIAKRVTTRPAFGILNTIFLYRNFVVNPIFINYKLNLNLEIMCINDDGYCNI